MFGLWRDRTLMAQNAALEAQIKRLSEINFCLEVSDSLMRGVSADTRELLDQVKAECVRLKKDNANLRMRLTSSDAATMQVEGMLTKVFNDIQSMAGRDGINSQWLRDYRKKISRKLGVKI